jgi:hypothetical protein
MKKSGLQVCFLLALVAILTALGTGLDGASTAAAETSAQELAGMWRAYSARIYYDEGGGGSTGGFTVPLELTADGQWHFGKSHGTFKVSQITDDDWARWGVNSYGPTRKVTFNDWSSSTADGHMDIWNVNRDLVRVTHRAGRLEPMVPLPHKRNAKTRPYTKLHKYCP